MSATDITSFTQSQNNIFVGSYSGVFTSTNNGSNWSAVNSGLFNRSVTCLASFGNNIFAGTAESGVFLSTNNGADWSLRNDGLMDSSNYALAVCDTILFAGGRSGKIFVTTDKGTNWSLVVGGLPAVYNVNFLAVNGSSIYAGTVGGGLWMRSLSQLVEVSREPAELPRQFTLSQNYPNPFNPSTAINYSLPKAGYVTITVYDAIGSKIATLVNDYKPAGSYSVSFIGKNLASGIYLYRLEAGNYSIVKKLLLVK